MRAKEYILDEVFTRIKNGVSIKQIKGGAGIPITRIETIANRYVDDTKFGYADIEDDKYSDSYLKNGDILLSHINSLKHIGKTALFEGFPYDVIHGMNLVGLRPDEKKVIPQYAFQFFQTDHFYKQILKFVKKSVNQVSVPVSAIKKIKIPLPSLDDQKRIAYLLTRCEELIGKRKESITLLDDYVKSVFLEMFGDPVINTKNYKKTELQNVANVISGFPFKSNRYSNKKDAIKICGGLIISPNRIVWEDAKKWEVTNSENLDQYYLNANDIVMALDRPWITSGFKIGKIEDNDLPSLLIQRTARIRSESFRYQFIYYSLKDRSFRFHCNPTETTVPHISLTELKKFELLDVPLTEQNQFAAIVEKVEKIKTNHESSLQELENLYGSLSQKAFMDPTLKLRISEENLDSSSSFKLQVAKGDLDVSELYELKNETGDVFAEHDILEVEIDKDYAVGKPLMNITVRNHILIKIGDSSKLINSGILNPEKWIKKTIDQICEFHFIKSSYADIILDEEKPKEDQLNNKIRQEFLSKALSIGLVVQQHMVIPLIEGLNLRDGGLLNSENSYRTRDSEIDINIQFIINFKIKNFNKNSRKLIRPGIDPIRILEQIVDGAIEKEMHQIEASKALLFNVSYDSESSEQTCEEILKDAIKDSLSSYGIESADIILKANQEEITQRFNELSKRTYQVELSIIPKIRDNYSEKVDFKLEYRIAGIVPEKLNVFFNRKFSDIQEEQDDLMNTIRNDLTAKFQD
ncbi:MAG: restriction endonuclease subunit S, partial [Bacteroidota bacterium]